MDTPWSLLIWIGSSPGEAWGLSKEWLESIQERLWSLHGLDGESPWSLLIWIGCTPGDVMESPWSLHGLGGASPWSLLIWIGYTPGNVMEYPKNNWSLSKRGYGLFNKWLDSLLESFKSSPRNDWSVSWRWLGLQVMICNLSMQWPQPLPRDKKSSRDSLEEFIEKHGTDLIVYIIFQVLLSVLSMY